jgi:hypothetical protein
MNVRVGWDDASVERTRGEETAAARYGHKCQNSFVGKQMLVVEKPFDDFFLTGNLYWSFVFFNRISVSKNKQFCSG